jgi:hypothetical protein
MQFRLNTAEPFTGPSRHRDFSKPDTDFPIVRALANRIETAESNEDFPLFLLSVAFTPVCKLELQQRKKLTRHGALIYRAKA